MLEIMLENLHILAPSLVLGTLLSLLAGPLGCLMVWRNLSYFGDCLAHTALLGLSIALWFTISTTWGLIIICILVGIITFLISEQKIISNDTILNIIAQLLLSIGLISIYHNPDIKFDMQAVLFGDILGITWPDVLVYAVISTGLLIAIRIIWPNMLKIILSEDMAKISGVKIYHYKFILQIILAIFYGVSIKLVGGLLSTALLVIPTVASKIIAKHPQQMAVFASILSILSINIGLIFSMYYDYPTGPCIVITAGIILCSLFIARAMVSSTKSLRH